MIVLSLSLLAINAMAAQADEPALQEPASEVAAGTETDATTSTIDPACKLQSEAMLDALGDGDYALASQAFNKKMRNDLPVAKLQEAWESLFTHFGTPKLRGDAQGKHGDGLSVIYTPLKFERGDLVSQVACDADGKVAGFYVVPQMPSNAVEKAKPVTPVEY
ncbi:MAG: DUF3887 domain-containing protein [Dokdonella sp.]